MIPTSSQPESDAIVLQLRDDRGGVSQEVTNFVSYSFNSHFLTPTDGFHFTIGDEAVLRSLLGAVYVGQRVSLTINGLRQADGYIDRIHVRSSRDGGTELTIEGRDRLSKVVDANADPQKYRFTANNTLEDVLVHTLHGFGWTEDHVLDDNAANANIITGQLQGQRTSKKGKLLKSFSLHQFKPYPQEGVFGFLSRLSQRFGLWIWLSADGEDVIVSRPNFEQPAIVRLVHKLSDTGQNNVVTGECAINGTNQPTMIIATGFGGGGEYDRSHMKVIMVNELTGLTAGGLYRSEVRDTLLDHPEATVLDARGQLGSLLVNDGVVGNMVKAPHRPIYLHDDESKTIEQLENFVRREMALRQRDGITAHYTFEGHTLQGAPWCVDTIVDVDDDALGLHTRMWVMSRTFEKSRMGGTTTTVELIMPYTLEFGE